MRKILISLLIPGALSFFPSFATVHTLCNMPYSPGQYTTFSGAHNAASNGDTIYVHGSNFSYGSISIYKPLVIIGTGHHPNKQLPLVSTFQEILIYSSNVQVIGVKCNYIQGYDNSTYAGYADCVIKKCRIEGTSDKAAIIFRYAENWLIEGNIINSRSHYACIDFTNTHANNTIIQHNIFISTDSYYLFRGPENNSSQRTYFLNNIMIGTATETLGGGSYVQVDNNIFYGCNPGGNFNTATFTMNHNISFNCTDNNFYTPGTNNLIGQDPRFISFDGLTSFSYNHDFHLAPDSPALNNGTDGTDRGVYGGLGPKFTMTGEPSIAEITSFVITSPTVIAPGGNLTISVGSKRVH